MGEGLFNGGHDLTIPVSYPWPTAETTVLPAWPKSLVTDVKKYYWAKPCP